MPPITTYRKRLEGTFAHGWNKARRKHRETLCAFFPYFHSEAVFPKTEIQNGIVHQIRNSAKYVSYKEGIRRLIGTTNAMEGFHRQRRKVTRAKSVFPTDDSLLKMLYLARMDITRKWTGRRQDWSIIHAQLAAYFAERMPD